jgi:hypothetical protein
MNAGRAANARAGVPTNPLERAKELPRCAAAASAQAIASNAINTYMPVFMFLPPAVPGRGPGIVFSQRFDYMPAQTKRKLRNSSLQFRLGAMHL